jgi:hypothetical protein
MMHLLLLYFSGPTDTVFGNAGLWLFLSIGAVSLFVVFIPLVSWIDGQRKEREAFYKAETIRRLVEASGEGAKAALELMRADNRLKRIKTMEGLKIGGIINICVGAALIIFLRGLLGGGTGTPVLVGLIPGFVGIGMLIYVFLLAGPVE